MLKIPKNYSLFDTSYGNEIPIEQLFVNTFDVMPSKFVNNSKKYSNGIIGNLQKNNFVVESEVLFISKRIENETNLLIFVNVDLQIIISVKNHKDKKYEYLNDV